MESSLLVTGDISYKFIVAEVKGLMTVDHIILIAIFIGVACVLTQVVNIVFRRLEKKNKAAHLRFSRGIIRALIIVLTIYMLAQQFELTKDMSTVLLQSGSLVIAVATFAAQHALSNVISGFSLAQNDTVILYRNFKTIFYIQIKASPQFDGKRNPPQFIEFTNYSCGLHS